MSEQRQVGPWRLDERLGEGGNATVWEATRVTSEERCALKLIKATKANKEPYPQRVIHRNMVGNRSSGALAGTPYTCQCSVGA
jgi:serine/threonine protein kinase